MMKPFLPVALGALLICAPASAAVMVSAGEHGAFSRVVIAANAGEARV